MHDRQAPGQELPVGREQLRRGHGSGGPVTAVDASPGTGGRLRHEAVYYDGPDDYRSAVADFLRAGSAGGEPALVAVPGPAAELIRDELASGAASSDVVFADMTQLGRNPGRIISAVWDFLDHHPRQPVRFVSEPAWPGRSAAELRETALHESMLNQAFASSPVSALCAYHVGLLAPRVIASATRTHPYLRASGTTRPNTDYGGGTRPRFGHSLSPPPARARQLAYTRDLRAVREAVADYAEQAGLTGERLADLIIAVSEVAANTTRHTPAGGTLYMWHTPAEVICEAADQGQIADPLVGRRRSPGSGGLGLWVVHQLCDLVELRTGRRGTRIRMHMRLERPAAAG